MTKKQLYHVNKKKLEIGLELAKTRKRVRFELAPLNNLKTKTSQLKLAGLKMLNNFRLSDNILLTVNLCKK